MSDELNFVMRARREKLEALVASGVTPFAYSFDRSHGCGAAQPLLPEGAEEGPSVRVAGRIVAWRGHGKTIFAHLADDTGRIQLYFKKDQLPEATFAMLAHFDLGDVIGVSGPLFRTRTGEVTVRVAEVTLLAKGLRPLPFGKEEVVDGRTVRYSGFADGELRSRQRYADLAVHPEVRRHYAARSRMTTAIRTALDALGYLEVETPVLQPLYGGALARPFTTHHNALDRDLYLRIATELYLKRCIVGGLEKVYELGKDFRNEGISYKHQPEFTMLEWYEAYADYRDTMERIETLVSDVALSVLGTTRVSFRGHEVELAPPWRRLRLPDALEEKGMWTRDEAELRGRLDAAGVDTARDHTWAQLVDHALSAFVEPDLVQPTILYDYPVELSPFARATDYDPAIVERFEYFVCSMELGNAFSEINTAAEQAARFSMQQAEREAGDALAEE
ncbi:MAG: lysine--tRNA ligase, partial [Gemmatimonadaceae bacterium]